MYSILEKKLYIFERLHISVCMKATVSRQTTVWCTCKFTHSFFVSFWRRAFARNVRPRIPTVYQPFYISIYISTLPIHNVYWMTVVLLWDDQNIVWTTLLRKMEDIILNFWKTKVNLEHEFVAALLVYILPNTSYTLQKAVCTVRLYNVLQLSFCSVSYMCNHCTIITDTS